MHGNRHKKTDFSIILAAALNRRQLIVGSSAFGGMALAMPLPALTSDPTNSTSPHILLDFSAIPTNTFDTVTVPVGYNWHIVASWGDPLWSDGVAFDHQTRGDSDSQKRAFGDNNDGMEIFTSNDRTILAINNESTTLPIMYGNRKSKRAETSEDVAKGQAAIGVTIMEISQISGSWSIVKDSEFNRRITANTATKLTGPAAGSKLVSTYFDPRGDVPIGTLNNCGSGRTPWNTYLSCEENFNTFFASSDPGYKSTTEMSRYGVTPEDRGYNWYQHDGRFDLSKHPNEANRFGYVLEIDPLNPDSPPKKLSALGRFKHENAALIVNHDNHVVVYMGDDERGEFIYRFVSEATFDPNGDNTKLLENGKLYVAKFNDDTRGTWIELTPERTGMNSHAEICVHTRQAGSLVGATTMDRPEWIAVDPHDSKVYCCLTNNKNRGKKPNAGGDESPIDGPNPRPDNKYGQIIRWTPDGNDHTDANFSWDLFALAGNPLVHSDLNSGSANINQENFFNCPDGLAFDSLGRLWIQTDGNYTNEGDFSGMGNNQMLVANAQTAEIKRFLVGPRECEVTGITWTADRKTMFVGIQHPGERGDSHFPGGGQSLPRSSIIAIRRDDGHSIG